MFEESAWRDDGDGVLNEQLFGDLQPNKKKRRKKDHGENQGTNKDVNDGANETVGLSVPKNPDIPKKRLKEEKQKSTKKKDGRVSQYSLSKSPDLPANDHESNKKSQRANKDGGKQNNKLVQCSLNTTPNLAKRKHNLKEQIEKGDTIRDDQGDKADVCAVSSISDISEKKHALKMKRQNANKTEDDQSDEAALCAVSTTPDISKKKHALKQKRQNANKTKGAQSDKAAHCAVSTTSDTSEKKHASKKKRQNPNKTEDNQIVQCSVTGSSKPDLTRSIQKQKLKRKRTHTTELQDDGSLQNPEETKVPALSHDQHTHSKQSPHPVITTPELKCTEQVNKEISDLTGSLQFLPSMRNVPLSSYSSKMKAKLDGSRFRWINEQLYTKESSDSQAMFKENPTLFDIYHKGFESQVKCWPQNPVDLIIAAIRKMKTDAVIADFGCGEAVIARRIPNKVHSFDLVARNSCVTACDMKHVPLASNSVDVAVYCLSLMGLNVSEFLQEAHRVLKIRGVLKIAEVVSRIENTKDLIQKICSMGFRNVSQDASNKMFVLMDFEKVKKTWTNVNVTLKPCMYKRR